jgi:hypothetical protein
MNWIKLLVVSSGVVEKSEVVEISKESEKGNIKLINLDYFQKIEPTNEGNQSILFQQDGNYIIADISFETLSNHIKPILTTSDLSGNEL